MGSTQYWRAWTHQLGILLGTAILSITFSLGSLSLSRFGVFVMLFSYFHFSEYAFITLGHKRANFDAMMLNHGFRYALAFSLASLEYFLSPFRLPDWTFTLGLLIALVGLFVRGLSLLTAGSAFTHLIATSRHPTHRLITGGIYSLMRHPGYFGWFLWVTGAQLLVGNPVCSVGFTVVTWLFFKERIEYEESLLVDMFGSEYVKYRQRTEWSGVPFIK